MSFETFSGLRPALNLGNALPSPDTVENGTHLYVSFSDLIMEYIFYHPQVIKSIDTLSLVEKNSLETILGSQSIEEHFVSTLVEKVKAAVRPHHKSIRIGLSNGDSYAFSSLLGGMIEDQEINPALGLRGVSRYALERFRPMFVLECLAIKKLKSEGVHVDIVVPFVRSLSDAAKIIDLLAEQELPRGLDGLKILYTVDVPSAALLADRLLHYFDGVVINLENLAQFTLGVDRLSEELEYLFDPQSEVVLDLIDAVVKSASVSNKPIVMTSSNLKEYQKVQEYLLEHLSIDVVVTL